VDKVLRTFSA